MIIGQDIHPERNLYYWGSTILEMLGSRDEWVGGINSFSLYEELKNTHDISSEIFLLALDWLFILGAIEGKRGIIKRCF